VQSDQFPRGIDHIGVTVPDIEAATVFLIRALGAEVVYDTLVRGEPAQAGPDVEARLGIVAGAKIVAFRMLKLRNGPGIELFEMEAPEQRSPARPSDFGLQHLAFYVDDIDAAARRFAANGGELFEGPHPLPGPERGDGNVFRYGRTPWGMIVEFITYPASQPYFETTPLRRWTP